MKLIDLFEFANYGKVWTAQTLNGVRHWVPHWSNYKDEHQNEIILPKELVNLEEYTVQHRKNIEIKTKKKTYYMKRYAAYELPAPGVTMKALGDYTKLVRGLMDALKNRSKTDVISPEIMKDIMDKCVGRLMGMIKTDKNNPQFNMLFTVPSSSNITKQFADELIERLGIHSYNVHHDKLKKRSVYDVYNDVHLSNIPDDDKQHMLRTLEPAMDKILKSDNPSEDFRLKYIQRRREKLAPHNIDIFEPTAKERFRQPQNINTLFIVDDNIQGGTSFQHTAKMLIESYDLDPKQIVALAMFKYNM